MRRWRFAFQRRWFGYLAMAILFAAICAGLSKWQVDRTNEARAENELVDRNFNATPRPLDEVLPTLRSYHPKQEWTQVTMSGTYLLKDQLLVRNRPFNGQPGFEVLDPLLLDDGRVFVVDRGYLPTGQRQDTPDSIPEPASERVSVVVRLQASEPNLVGRTGVKGQLATVHVPDVATVVKRPTYTAAYGLMVSESPAAATRPTAMPEPTVDEGLHISYAIQWVLFAIGGFLGLGYAIRQEYRIHNSEDPRERERAAERERRRAERRSDADVEDELLDSAR